MNNKPAQSGQITLIFVLLLLVITIDTLWLKNAIINHIDKVCTQQEANNDK